MNKLFEAIKEAAGDDERKKQDSMKAQEWAEEGESLILGRIQLTHHPKNPTHFFSCYLDNEPIGILNNLGEFQHNGDFPINPAIFKYIENLQDILMKKFGIQFQENPWKKNRNY